MKRNWLPIVIKITLSIFLLFVVYLIFQSIQEKGDEHEQSIIGRFHNIGDALGGMSAPIIGLISSLLIYLSFQEQVTANRLVVEIQNENSLNGNLKDFLVRIEDKFKRIVEAAGSEKRFNDLFLSLAGHYGFLTNIGKQRLAQVPPFNLETDAPPIIEEIRGLQENCVFFCNYILRVARRTNLTTENRDLISLYIAEYLSFFNNKLSIISPLTPLNFSEDDEIFLNNIINRVVRNHRFLQERGRDLEEANILFVQSDRGRLNKWTRIWRIITEQS